MARQLSLFSRMRRQFSTLASSSSSKTTTTTCQSSVMLQFGLNICELPLVLSKLTCVQDIEKAGVLCNANIADNNIYYEINKDNKDNNNKLADSNNDNKNEWVLGFRRCATTTSLMSLLQTVPSSEITPFIAMSLIERLVQLQINNYKEESSFREQLRKTANITTQFELRNNDDVPKGGHSSLVHSSIMTTLVDIVSEQGHARHLINTLSVIISSGNRSLMVHKSRLVDSLLRCLSERRLSLRESCESILLLSHASNDMHIRDKLWSGIVNDDNSNLNAFDVALVFSILPYLNRSRRLVQRYAEDQLAHAWHKLGIKQVLGILKALDKLIQKTTTTTTGKVLPVICHWLSVNLHCVKEPQLMAILYCLHRLHYVDDNAIRSVERYTKAAVVIKDVDLLVTISDYLVKFGVRSPIVLDRIAEHLISNSNSNRLSLPQFHSLSTTFGSLNYTSKGNHWKLWQAIERHLEHHVFDYPKEELAALLLSFVYAGQISIPSRFISALSVNKGSEHGEDSVTLKKLKVALAIEHRDENVLKHWKEATSKSSSSEHSTNSHPKLIDQLATAFSSILGSCQHVEKSVKVLECYPVDLMIRPQKSHFFSLTAMNPKWHPKAPEVAVILLDPEENCYNGVALRGSSAMRLRHLCQLGFRVLHLQLEDVLRAQQDGRLEQLLRDEYIAIIKNPAQ